MISSYHGTTGIYACCACTLDKADVQPWAQTSRMNQVHPRQDRNDHGHAVKVEEANLSQAA